MIRYGTMPGGLFYFLKNIVLCTKISQQVVERVSPKKQLPFRLSVAKAHRIDPNVDLFNREHNKRQELLQRLALSSFVLGKVQFTRDYTG